MRRSLVITFLSTNASTIVQFFVTVVVSRYLSPKEIGIFSITVVFVGVIAVFRDFGVTSYLQREEGLTPAKLRSALGLLLTTSWVLSGLIYLSSPHVARFYNEPGIENVINVFSISYLLLPFASYFYAIHARNLEAGKQAVVNAFSTIAFAVSCLGLVYLGHSYMALAWANVINIAVTILVYLVLKHESTPLMPSWHGWQRPAAFGSGAILGNLIDKLNASIPDLLLGKTSGAAAVGLYSRASGLVGIFQQIFGPTIGYSAVPIIAKNHHLKADLSPLIFKAASYLTCISWFAFILTAILAAEVIEFLYGKQWLPAAPIVIIICVQAAIRAGFTMTQPALMAIGKPYLSAASSGFSALLKIAPILAFGITDLYNFALAICAAEVGAVIVFAVLSQKYLGYAIHTAVRAYWVSFKVCAPCLVFAFVLKATLPAGLPNLLVIALVGSSSLLVWLVCVFWMRHPLRLEIENGLNHVLPPRLAGPVQTLLRRHTR